MAWYTPDSTSFESIGMTAAEFTAITGTSLPDGETGSEMLARKIEEVVNHIRLYVGMPGRTLGAAGTIPDELKMEFTALLRRLVFERMPDAVAKKFFGESRQQAALRADETLIRVSKVTTGIVTPATESEDQPAGSGAEVVQSRTRIATRDKWNGL